MDYLTFHVDGEGAGDVPLSAALYRPSEGASPFSLLVLAHGAGAGQFSSSMKAYAAGLAARGVVTVTFNFPYTEAKRRTPDRAPVLERAFRRAIVASARHPPARGRRLFIGGKSMGGRMATHLAAGPAAWPDAPALAGVVVFGYPLRPPGRHQSGDRVSHLHRRTVPMLIVQGTRDPFGSPEDIRVATQGGAASAPLLNVLAVEGGDHSLGVPKSAPRTGASVLDEMLDGVVAWMRVQEAAGG
ncbi:MAG: hypothetical protein LC791_15395 [Acidobacteria bacterium]|nr:hypothetical protein [Acidobacteriota bacterium]